MYNSNNIFDLRLIFVRVCEHLKLYLNVFKKIKEINNCCFESILQYVSICHCVGSSDQESLFLIFNVRKTN